MIVRLSKKTNERIFAYLLLLPAIIIISAVIIIPLVEAIGYSFTRTSLINFKEKSYIGFENYKSILSDSSYYIVLKNTIFIVFSSVGLSLVIGMLLALVLNNSNHTNILRGLFIIPWLIPGVVIGIIWKWVLATEAGVLNFIFRAVGLTDTNFPFLSDQKITPWLVVIVFIWSSVPYILVTVLAALQSVSQDLEEAAIIDGATATQRFFAIIIPIITPVISIAVVLRVIYTMQDFAIIYSLTQGGPGNATETFVISVYKTAFNSSQIGMACAIGVIWLLLLLVFVLAYFKLLSMSERRMYA